MDGAIDEETDEDAERLLGEQSDLIARALQRLLPPLVHQLNNALAVIQGVHELESDARAAERGLASEKLVLQRRIFAALGRFARMPSVREQELDLRAAFDDVVLLAGSLAADRRVRIEVRADAALVVRAEGRFEALLLALVCALVDRGGKRAEPARLRLCARSTPRGACLVVAGDRLDDAGAADELAALAAHVAGRGWQVRTRRRSTAFAFWLSIPVRIAGSGGEPVRRSRRVLLVHTEGEQRELVATVLREHGCFVREASGEPDGGVFDLVLVEASLARTAPDLAGRLRARFPRERVEFLPPHPRPAAVLALIE